MTTPNEPTPVDEQTPAPEPDADDTAIEDSELDPRTRDAFKKLRSENRNLRTRLRDRDEQLRARDEQIGEAAAVVSAMQLAEVKRVAGEVLHDPDDLIAHQPDMTAYFDEQFAGMVSADRVTEQAKALIAQRPHLGKPPSGPPPTGRPLEGLRSGARAEEPTPKSSWATALRGA
jgi:hypothetical protein